jgi:hypothetical protein
MSKGNEHLYYVEKTLVWREINYQHPPIRFHNKPLLVKAGDDLFVDSYSRENGWGKIVDCEMVWVAVVNWP